jgi:hypothetical protein
MANEVNVFPCTWIPHISNISEKAMLVNNEKAVCWKYAWATSQLPPPKVARYYDLGIYREVREITE